MKSERERSPTLVRLIAATFFVAGVCSSTWAQGPSTVAATAKADPYDTLISKLRSGETAIDYRELRHAYAARKDADGAGSDHLVRRTMNVALAEKRYQDTIKIAEGILATVYISPDTHAALSRAYTELGDPKKAAVHKAIYLGLINSVLAEGNGETFATAYKVVTVEEPYAVMRALGFSVWGQVTGTKSGQWFEIISVTDPKTSTSFKVYFNIDIPRSIQARMAAPKP
jgi:Domain of unknown function (DUF4919)